MSGLGEFVEVHIFKLKKKYLRIYLEVGVWCTSSVLDHLTGVFKVPFVSLIFFK